VSRRLTLAALAVLVAGAARAAFADADATAASAIGDQAVGAELGIAGGGRVTPGGFRLAGH
jgi:hypothetical protein